jgi:HEAT repeat-containing protein 5
LQLQPISASGSGALEHDPCCLYRPLQKNETSPGPLPLGVSVIDMSAMLFGNVFSYVSNKHRLQMLEHFSECIKHAKSQRQEAVQMNIFTALLCGLKGLTESKCSIGQDDVKKSATNLIINGLISPNPILRCAAGETLGRIAQVVGDSRFTAELAQTSFDRLKSARDVVTRTGHSLALGCLHRCVGGMGSSQHLNTSVSILLALAQDSSSPVVQVWSLYALAMIADSGGPMFRGYIEPALSMGLKLLLTVPQSNVDVHQCVGRVLSALITTIGPELQGNETSICSIRSNILCACAIMQAHSDPLVQAEAVGCLQQLHLFAPKFVNLSSLVPTLCRTLSSNYLILRKAAISCLRQLTTREAREVTEHALSIFTDDDGLLSEYGLMGMLFAMLDTETDQEMIKNIHDTIVSMLQMLAADNLSHWLSMCKRVLTVASESDNGGNEAQTVDNDGEDEDDNAEFHAEEPTQTHPAVQPRWKTRVFAAECVRKIIVSCEQGSPKHFDLIAAKDLNSRGDFLVLHLSDLIRMSFMAATSDSDQLRLEGLKTLQEIVDKFARVPEPEFPGHLLLEQFQAQVSAALRPAFASETPSHVTAAACEVCSAWIGSGVARDLNDLRRVHQLLVQSLAKLQSKTNSTLLYNESMATLEKLSILKAWAQVYIIAMISNGSSPTQKCLKKLKSVQNSFSAPSDDEMFEEYEPRGESLLSLVQPELENLSRHWLAALRDYALLSLPSEYSSQLPHDGGAFFTTDTINSSKPHYQSSWPQILIASSLWLNSGGFESGLNVPTTDHTETRTQTITHGSLSADRFYLIFGICMESLCSTRSNEKLDCVIACLTALYTIFDSKWARETMAQTKELLIELSNVLYRQILTRDSLEVQLLSVEIMKQSIAIARDSLNVENDPNGNDVDNNEENVIKKPADSEDLSDPTKSHVYAILEVIVCLLARHCPELNPSQTTRLTFEKPTNLSTNGNYRLNDDNNMIVGLTLNSMEDLPSLCTHEGAVKILPTILYLTTGVIQEMATKSCHDNAVLANCGAIQAALHLLKAMTVHKYASDEKSADDWRKYLESALAKIIDLTKTGSNDEKKLDEVTMMLAIAVFILHAPKVVMMPTFQYPSINLFRQCFQSDSTIVRLKCIQTAKSIFLNADLKVATPYIHSLAPRIIEHLFDDNTKCPKDEIELTLIQESITTVDCLITLAEPQNRKFFSPEISIVLKVLFLSIQ